MSFKNNSRRNNNTNGQNDYHYVNHDFNDNQGSTSRTSHTSHTSHSNNSRVPHRNESHRGHPFKPYQTHQTHRRYTKEEREGEIRNSRSLMPPQASDGLAEAGAINAGWGNNEAVEASTVSYTSSETINASEQVDDDEIDWVYSKESTSSSNLDSDRPQSPHFDLLDKEHNNKMDARHKSPQRNLQYHDDYNNDNHKNDNDNDDHEFPKDEGDNYKGRSFSPPFPICPVIPTVDVHTESKLSHIFDNDSRSSAQSFENLVQIAKEYWNDHADVPLHFASAQDPKEYLKKKPVREENMTSSVPPKVCEEKVDGIRSPTTVSSIENLPNHGHIGPSIEHLPNHGHVRHVGHDTRSSGSPSKDETDKQSRRSMSSQVFGQSGQLYKRLLSPVRERNAHRAADTTDPLNKIVGNMCNISEYSAPTVLIQDTATSLRPRKAVTTYKKSRGTEEVCSIVDSIFRATPTDWLNYTLAAIHKLIPKIVLFNTETIQKLLKILSSHLVLKTNNKDTEQLIKIVIADPGFFEKVFSYMKEEINCGSDLVPIIRLIEFIVKLSPEAVQKVPINEITEVCKRVESTFSEAESIEVRAKHKEIRESYFRMTKKVDQNITPTKPQKPQKPYWLISHMKDRVEKPLIPSFEEIFNLESMITKPRLTHHLVDWSWLPEYEEVYRQVHYDLLRTEVVEDLQRASVAFYAANCQEYQPPENSPIHNYIFYNDVQVVNTYIDKNFTPYVRVGFKPSRPVDWIKGEHLIYGTFVLLFKVKIEFNYPSVDMSSMVWAMVEHFNLEDVERYQGPHFQPKESFVGLNFSVTEFEKLDLNGKYFMLESTRDYALIKPVMEWLKESANGIRNTFPLHQELFKCYLDKRNNSTPGYLENVAFDITSLLADKRRPVITKDRSEWPSYETHGTPAYDMEFSCVVALRQIISSKVAAIVAPVVTSKAKVAAKAVELLNQAFNQSHCYEPIIILARSTYALDSILEQLLPSFPDLIRCGSFSKCGNPNIKSRRIQEVVNDRFTSKKTTLFREWKRIRDEMNYKQSELADLWRFKRSALSLQYFIDSCPKAFRDQLIPVNNNKRPGPGKEMFVRCLKLWLAGESGPSVNANIMENDFPAFVGSSNRLTSQSFTENVNPQIPLLLKELSKSYLFENDWTKSNGCNNDVISMPSKFDKEILDHQINDRVIFKSEEGQANSNEWFTRGGPYRTKNKTDFENATKSFWSGDVGPNIWSMSPDARSSLYKRFCQHHLNYCDQKIRDLQKNAILEAEKVKSTRIARWTEVCNFTPVIGMTLSYATSHREVLTSIKPRVCIVDEASEISEAQLMFLISSDRLEHLIMFGDIQYSKPDVKSKTAQMHGLDVSLFERWIRCGGEYVGLRQQSRMHPSVHGLVSTLYEEERTENVVAESNSKILGVPSHVFFMTHNNFDDDGKQMNTFEATFIVRFAYYLYQQGYDPAKITILTPYFPQKRLILESLKPELRKHESITEEGYGRYDKERNKTGMIKVELIDDYNSDENQIVLLSLVAVRKNWYKAALETLNNKKRAIIALSRAIRALYIFGNEAMLRESEIWAPVVNKLAETPNTYGKSLILSCKNHINTKIEITNVKDFETKVPYGGCSEPCNGLLKCGHACSRKCHPIHHSDEVNYICHRQCGGRYRPEGCEHECPKKCYECEQSGKCPPCNKLVEVKLRCRHEKSIPCHQALNMDRANHVCEEYITLKLRCGHETPIRCYQKDNEQFKMTMECKFMKNFTFKNCGHSVRLACGTNSPVCREICRKSFPCGHRCQLLCGVEHSHERSDCKNECVKSLICGHFCANGCSEPDRHTSFCNKPCRIKCLHGRICPNTCYKTCTKCLELCPWECQHYKCSKKCSDPCNRPPCQSACPMILSCKHPCNGFCGEMCPPCIKCNPNMQCKITLQNFSEMCRYERLYILPECRCVFTADGLDMYFQTQVKSGEHTAVKLWQCPSCQEPIFTAMRYNHYLKTEINLWNIIKRRQELDRSSLSTEERRQIIDAMNEETRTTDINSMVGGRWFVCPNNHPYYIGNCGGATQISRCPDCSEIIGGTQHRVVSSNRFCGEFDNSASPAWPGQH